VLPWEYDDGGRRAAGYKGNTGDCVTRAITIAAGGDYRPTYEEITDRKRRYEQQCPGSTGRVITARWGAPWEVVQKLATELGGTWHSPTPDGAIPTTGRVIVAQDKHVFAVVNGIVRDTFNATTKQRPGERRSLACIGYWTFPNGGDDTLSSGELGDLRRHEDTIFGGLQTFMEVGAALAKIRDNRLYRASHATFAEYCRDRFGLSKPYAHQIITASRTASAIADAKLPPPINEAQARELARLPDPAARVDVWRAALDQSDDRPTAAVVRDLVRLRRAADVKPAPEPVADPEPEQRTETIDYDEAVRQGRALVDEQCGVYSKRLGLIAEMVAELAADDTPETVTRADERVQWRKSIGATIDTLEALFDRLGPAAE
jgi:hypothetical protein